MPTTNSTALTATATAGPTSVRTATPTPTTPSAEARQRAEVVRVTDGDTIRVRIEGREYAVRYIGIDTPETVDPRKDIQCFGREATAFNVSLVAGKIVELEKDVSEVDRYGRLLRYVWADGRMVNEELVGGGYALSASYPPDIKYQDRFQALHAAARDASRGLWGAVCVAVATPAPAATALVTTSPPVTTPVPTVSAFARPAATTSAPARTVTPAPRTNCDPAYPTVCIPPAPPDLDCGDIPFRRFVVRAPDPHRFDGDKDGIGCE